MKTTATALLACTLLILLGCQADPAPQAQAPEKLEPAQCGTIKQLHVANGIYLAGQPAADDFALLQGLGIKTVLNIRHARETPDLSEAKLSEELGMTYIHLPWNGPDELTDAMFDDMRRVLRDAERPMLFHCGSANRVGAGWLAYRVLDQGMELDDALAEAKVVGMRTPAYEARALDYISQHR